MPFWARLGELVFVHGGISGRFAEMPIQFHPPESLMWSRGVSPKWSGPMVVSGHTIVAEPTVDGKQILLDTGCFEGRWLTCGILNRRTGALCAALQISMDGKDFQEWWPN
jgi:hypothetical protein